jgi:hypothetical protein
MSTNYFTTNSVEHVATLGKFATADECMRVSKQLKTTLDARVRTACIQANIVKD